MQENRVGRGARTVKRFENSDAGSVGNRSFAVHGERLGSRYASSVLVKCLAHSVRTDG
jgi:hypothetical protein